MIIIGLNSTGSLVYVYAEDNTKIHSPLEAVKNGKIAADCAFMNYIVIVNRLGSETYYFFYDKIRNKKDARHATKVMMKAVLNTFPLREANQQIFNKSENIILHNAKNIIHDITEGLRSKLNFNELIYLPDDKVKYIEELVQKDTYGFSRELLRCEKALEQVSYEYNCLDFISSGELLNNADRSYVKIHSCMVQAFYIYENNFHDKNITVNIGRNHDEFFCNFFSMRSAFALLFENCVKYCKTNSNVEVNIEKQPDNSIKIDFDMISVFNDASELDMIFLEGTRGQEAVKKSGGNGLGLFLARRLLEINGFSIVLKSIPDSDTYDKDIHYCRNIFVIDIPHRFVRTE